jgi:hypothetical protein
MITPFRSYSPEVTNAVQILREAQYYWCIAGDRPPNCADEFVFKCSTDAFDETQELTFRITVTALPPALDKKAKLSIEFQRLVEQWKGERGSRSSITQVAMMRPYQEIMAMGPDAIPLIIAQMKSEGDEPDQWFWALRVITRENPVRPEDRGNFRKMAQAWIQWAEQREHAW